MGHGAREIIALPSCAALRYDTIRQRYNSLPLLLTHIITQSRFASDGWIRSVCLVLCSRHLMPMI